MHIIQSYKIFESGDKEDKMKGLVDLVCNYLPKTRKDRFTQDILPYIKTIVVSHKRMQIDFACKTIMESAASKFGGYDKEITPQETLERFIDHYISGPDRILDKHSVDVLIRKIRKPVKKSKKKDKNFKIGLEQIDKFTDNAIEQLMRQGISIGDVKLQLKKIYTWAFPILEYFYHPITIKKFKYKQSGILFSKEELLQFYPEDRSSEEE